MKRIVLLIFAFIFSFKSKADVHVDSLNKALNNTSDPAKRFDLLNKIVDYSDATQGNFQPLGLEMHRIAQQLKNDSLLAISTNIIGNYFRAKSDYATALTYFFKALPLAEKAKDKRRISSIYFDIAEYYRYMQNFAECYKYCKLGGENLPDKNSTMYDFMALQYDRTMGLYHLKMSQQDSVLFYVNKLELDNSRLKKSNSLIYCYTLRAAAYAKSGDNEMAEMFFKKGNELVDSIATPLLILVFNQIYIPYLLSTDQIDKAKASSFKLLNTGKEVGNNVFKSDAAGFLSQAYIKLQKPDSAYFYLSMQSALKDSIFNQNNFNTIQTLAFNEEIRKIDEEAKQKLTEEERKQNIQLALIAFGIISFIIIFLLLSRSVITNTRVIEILGVVALLIVFEFLNLLLHPFLERITHHSPILMLLGLVCIAAILVPLHHKLEHWATHKLIEKNKAIRLAEARKTIEKLDQK